MMLIFALPSYAWPGRCAVSESPKDSIAHQSQPSCLTQSSDSLRRLLHPSPGPDWYIELISTRGYELISTISRRAFCPAHGRVALKQVLCQTELIFKVSHSRASRAGAHARRRYAATMRADVRAAACLSTLDEKTRIP
jgi:hypothetical protein